MRFKILFGRTEVRPYIKAVQQAGDSERNAFGFLPKNAYQEFADQGRLLVAIAADSQTLCGYIVYGGALPQAKIFQTYCCPTHRGTGVGRSLIEALVLRIESAQFLSVRAEVADDLLIANQFYGELGFDVTRVKSGGKSRNRKINIRVRELSTPSLLDFIVQEEGAVIEFIAPTFSHTPLYLVDINVLMDVAKQRSKASASGLVLATGFENNVTVAVAAEFIDELERTSDRSKPDQVLGFARAFPRLPSPSAEIIDQRVAELGPLIFPDRFRGGCLTPQDKSDLIHIATAIGECAAGFVTSEKAILRSSRVLSEKYGLEVLSPEAFGQGFAADEVEKSLLEVVAGSSQVSAFEMQQSDQVRVEAFLTRLHVTGSRLRAATASGTATQPRRRRLVISDGELVAFGSWNSPQPNIEREIAIYADEQSSLCGGATELLLRTAIRDIGVSRPSLLQIKPLPGQTTVRQVAIRQGFRSSGGPPRLTPLRKATVGCWLAGQNYTSVSDEIQRAIGLKLPAEIPRFTSLHQEIQCLDGRGRRVVLPLGELESLLSPFLLDMPERRGVILPITPHYAEELFRGSAQPTFLPSGQAVFLNERGYISGANTYRAITEGGLAVFYESGGQRGRMAAIAVSRVVRRYLLAKPAAGLYAESKGVLAAPVIEQMGRSVKVTVTEFDNLMLFSTPVTLQRLREIGCADGANFVTAKSIAAPHLRQILSAGAPRA